MKKNDIRVTFAVDRSTVTTLDRLAREWGVSKSEAMRRAVQIAQERVDMAFSGMSPTEVLEHFARYPTRTAAESEAWQEEARRIRRSWGEPTESSS